MGPLSRLLVRRPLLANTVSSGVLLGVGDAIQQGIEFRRGVHKESSYNWRRTGRMLVIGLIEGPPHHWWYTALDRLLPGRTARTVRQKILADQLVAAPLFALTFFVGMDLLEGRTLRDGLMEFRRKFPEVYLFDWCIWPPTQWLNFTYVPERYRVLYVNVVTVVWDVFLSFSKHRDQQEAEGESPALRQPQPTQLSVSALESELTDSPDSGLLESEHTDSPGSRRSESEQTGTTGCESLELIQAASGGCVRLARKQPATAGPEGGLLDGGPVREPPGCSLRTADGAVMEISGTVYGKLSGGPNRDSDAVIEISGTVYGKLSGGPNKDGGGMHDREVSAGLYEGPDGPVKDLRTGRCL